MDTTTKKDFSKPTEVTQLDMAFGGEISDLMPAYNTVPEEFKDMNDRNKFNKVISTWFFGGLPKETEFYPKEGIDTNAALRHVGAVLRSFEPKHEHKEAGCAYLLSLWFDDIQLPEKKKDDN